MDNGEIRAKQLLNHGQDDHIGLRLPMMGWEDRSEDVRLNNNAPVKTSEDLQEMQSISSRSLRIPHTIINKR